LAGVVLKILLSADHAATDRYASGRVRDSSGKPAAQRGLAADSPARRGTPKKVGISYEVFSIFKQH